MGIKMQPIAIFDGTSRYDGIHTTIRDTYTALTSERVPVGLYSFTDPGHGKEYEGGIVIKGRYLPSLNLEMGLNRLFVFPWRSRRIRENVILLSDPTMLFARAKGRNVSVFVHDLRPLTAYCDNRFTGMMFKLVVPRLKSVDSIIVHTEHLRGILSAYGIDIEKVHVIPPSVSWAPTTSVAIERINQSVEKLESGKGLDLLCVATDRPYKNIDFLMALVRQALSSQSSVELRFHLVSRLKPETRRKIPPNSEGFPVTIYETIPNLAELYGRMDMLLFPSLFEGFGRPMIEAMSCGLPVIANNIDPMKEVLKGTSLLADTNDLTDWMQKVMWTSSPANYRKAAMQSLHRYDHFSWEKFKARLLEFCSNL